MERPRAILLLAKSGGFVPQFELQNVRLLREMGYRIFYAADFSRPVYGMRQEELDALGVTKIQIAVSGTPLAICSHLGELKKLKELTEREHITAVHCHTPVGGFLGRMLGRMFGRELKVIYTAHGFHFYQGAPVINWLFYPAEALMARYTDALITINREDFRRAKNFHLRPGGRVYRIPGVGICKERLQADEGAGKRWRQQHGIPQNAFHLLTMGELNRNKNHAVILRAMKRLSSREIFCSIAGEGGSRAELEREIAAFGLEDRVRLVGYQEDAASFLASGDAFLFPSRREGLGMAALEAMTVGLPVIAADNRGTREYMRQGVNGYICGWKDEKGFAVAINRLYRDPLLRETMGQAARRTAEKFSRERTTEIMARIYRNTLPPVRSAERGEKS